MQHGPVIKLIFRFLFHIKISLKLISSNIELAESYTCRDNLIKIDFNSVVQREKTTCCLFTFFKGFGFKFSKYQSRVWMWIVLKQGVKKSIFFFQNLSVILRISIQYMFYMKFQDYMHIDFKKIFYQLLKLKQNILPLIFT